jgi:hypothetical protein
MMTKTFDKSLMDTFIVKLLKINKKLAKYGKGIEILSTTEKTYQQLDEAGNSKTVVSVTVELSGPEILHNGRKVQHVGTISFKDGVKQIFNAIEGDLVLGTIEDSKLGCDHCHINRNRVKYFFFKEEEKLLCIGSSCAIDYFMSLVDRATST